MKDIIRIIKFTSAFRRLTIGVVILSILSSLASLISPLIFKALIDLLIGMAGGKISQSLALAGLMRVTIFFAIAFGITITIRLADQYLGSIWYHSVINQLIKKAFNHLHGLSLSFFEGQSSGKIKERVDKGIWDLQEVIDGIVNEILPQFILIGVAIVILARINILLALLSFIGLPFFVLVSIKTTRTLNKKQDQIRDVSELASGLAMQSIIGVKTVKSYNKENFEEENFTREVDKVFTLNQERNKTRTGLNFLRFLILDTTRVVVVAYAGYLAIMNKISAGDIFLFFAYIGRVYDPLWRLTYVYDKIQERMRTVKRVLDLLDTDPEIIDVPGAKRLNKIRGEVAFYNTCFGYNNKLVLKNISFKVKEGEIVALVGPSGVGKSTIAKLILRLYDTKKGSILIDNEDISKVTQKSLRENIGVVLQDTLLFNNSVLENIRYGKLKAKKEDVIKAAKVANAHDFVMKLPKGYKTIVGERGIKLSGGEQQRINIARAVLKNAPILILDEATSHLDSHSEMLVQDALWKLIKGRTTIIIAHRLSTVMKADKILVLNKGKVVETGKHEELIKKDGLYAKLFKIQSGAMLLTDKEEVSV